MANITNEQYLKIRSYLHLITFDEAYKDDTPEVRNDLEYKRKYYPCYKFDPASLNNGVDILSPEYIDSVILLGRRNPWNCAQLIASWRPELLERL